MHVMDLDHFPWKPHRFPWLLHGSCYLFPGLIQRRCCSRQCSTESFQNWIQLDTVLGGAVPVVWEYTNIIVGVTSQLTGFITMVKKMNCIPPASTLSVISIWCVRDTLARASGSSSSSSDRILLLKEVFLRSYRMLANIPDYIHNYLITQYYFVRYPQM